MASSAAVAERWQPLTLSLKPLTLLQALNPLYRLVEWEQKAKEIGLPEPYRDSTITLRDGRQLRYAAYGNPWDKLAFWFHGTPGSCYQIPPDAAFEAQKHGFQVVMVDRPGIGGSTHHPERTLLSFADDIGELADQLGHEEFSVIGLSGGGPYVMACSYQHPTRVRCGISLGGVGPCDDEDGAPGYRGVLKALMRMVEHSTTPLAYMASGLLLAARPVASTGFNLYVMFGPQEDRPVFERIEMKTMFCRDIVQGSRNGIRAPIFDIRLFSKPWGFSPRNIQVPMLIWHGTADTIVPISHSEYLQSRIPRCKMYVSPGLGHFAGFMSCPAVFEKLAEVWETGKLPKE